MGNIWTEVEHGRQQGQQEETHDNNGALDIMEVSLSFMINYEGVAGGNCAN